MSLAKKGKKFVKTEKFNLAMEKLSEDRKGNKNPMYGVKGKKASNWRGGKTKEAQIIRTSPEYKRWRTKVFIRDKFTCQNCGSTGVELNADHIKQFAYYPELRFELSNGRTLCVPCHKKTETYSYNGLRKCSKIFFPLIQFIQKGETMSTVYCSTCFLNVAPYDPARRVVQGKVYHANCLEKQAKPQTIRKETIEKRPTA